MSTGKTRILPIHPQGPPAGVGDSAWTVRGIPPGVRFRLLCLSWTLTADATVANRWWGMQLIWNSRALYAVQALSAHLASTSRRYTAAIGAQLHTGTLPNVMPSPDCWLPPDTVIQIVTGSGGQAGDLVSSICMLIEIED